MGLELTNLSGMLDPASVVAVRSLPLDSLRSYPSHPFRVEDDHDMAALTTSISRMGVRNPLLVRPLDEGFEVVSGHRRLHAARQLGLESVPCVVADLSDDEATVLMVDSNLSRTQISVREKARAYSMRHQALKHQGSEGGSTRARISVETGESEATVARLVRLARLIDPLLDAIDHKRMGVRAGLRLTGLSEPDQQILTEWLEENPTTVSDALAVLIDTAAKGSPLTADTLDALASSTPVTPRKLSLPADIVPAWVPVSKRTAYIATAVAEYARNHPQT